MRDESFLLVRVGAASLVETFGLFALVSVGVVLRVEWTSGVEALTGAASVCISCGLAIWWIFRELNAHYSKREAKAMATAFGVFTPVSLTVSILLAQLGGSFVGALIGSLVINTLLSFAVCLFVLRMTRRVENLENSDC